MATRVNAGLPRTSCNRLTTKLAKQFRFDDAAARERNAEYGRELVGLNIHIPWSAWDGYPDGSGFETGTVFEYQSKHRPYRFVIAFPTAKEIDDISLSWELAVRPRQREPNVRRILARPIPTVTAAQRGAVWGGRSRRRKAVVARALRRCFLHQARHPHV